MSINHRTLSVMIGNTTSAPANKAAMVEGELFVVGPDMETAAVATDDYFYVVQRTATGFKYSNKIQRLNVKKYQGHEYAAATEQVSYVGYDGTSGSIVVNDETEYAMNIVFKHDKDIWSQRQHKKTQHYTTGGATGAPVTATQAEIADNLAIQFSSEQETMTLAAFERLSDEAGAAMGAAADTLVGVAGSTSIIVTDTGADSSVTAIAAGDYIRIGTATTDPVYKVITGVPVTGGTIVVDQPLQASFSLLGTTTEIILAAAQAAAECGISVRGLAQTFNTLDFYEQVQFELALDGGFHIGGNTSLAEFGNGASASPESGSGTYEKVFDLENKAQGYEGITNRTGFPIPAFPVYADTAGQYDVYVVSHDDVHGSSSLNRDIASPMDTMICVNQNGSDDATSAIEDALDALLVTPGAGVQGFVSPGVAP